MSTARPASYKRLIHDLKRNQQTRDGSKVIATTDQSLQFSRFDDQSCHDKTDLSEPEIFKYHQLTTTLHLTLKMTTAQAVETSVTNNSLSKDYLHPDDHAKQIIYYYYYYHHHHYHYFVYMFTFNITK